MIVADGVADFYLLLAAMLGSEAAMKKAAAVYEGLPAQPYRLDGPDFGT